MDIVKIETGGLCGAVLGPEHPAGARRGDLVLVMSNGGFGGFIDSLLSRLSERAS